MRIPEHLQTTDAAPRAVRRGLLLGVGAAGALLVTLSVAYACTFGVHGGLLIVQEEPSEASASGGPTVDPNGNGQIDLKLYSTDNNQPQTPFVPDNPYDVYIDPDPLGGGGATNVDSPNECSGDSDDVDIGDISYGFEENGIPAQNTQVSDEDDDPDRYVYGEGTASIDPTDTDTTNDQRDGGDVAAPAPPAVGTYEICAMPHYRDHWDHFRIVYTS